MSEKSRIPKAPAPYKHRLPVQLRFNDVDMFGHVNNTVYLEFFDMGKYDYFRSVMGDDFDSRKIALVVANINCNFFAPTFLDESLEVLTTTVSIGEKSVVLDQRIINPRAAEVKCQCTTVMVGFDIATGFSAPVADLWRTKLQEYEGRQLS